MSTPLHDKILEAILRIKKPTRFSCEFGAWDGQHLLNCGFLIREHGHQAVLIKADAKKYRRLVKNYPSGSGVECLHRMVGWTPADSLDFLLQATSCPPRPDFLSIDVDGNDYHIWKAVEVYQPSVVCVEFNPTIPQDVEFVQPPDPRIQWGSSLRSFFKLGLSKRYRIIHVDFHDILFGSEEYFLAAGIMPTPWDSIRMDTSAQCQLFIGYDGRLLLRGATTLRWNGLRFYEEDLQILPGWLQKLPDSMNFVQRACLELLRLWRRWRASWRRRLGFPLRP